MGCSRFHVTWWPTFRSDVIDPDKSFDSQRRINLIKKVVTSLIFAAIIAGVIYLVVSLLSKGSSTTTADHDHPLASSILFENITSTNLTDTENFEGTTPTTIEIKEENFTTVENVFDHDKPKWIGLTKNFKTNFLDSSSPPVNSLVTGFLTVKATDDDPWRPFCSDHWGLELGYQFCKDLGNKTLFKLTTSRLSDIKDRMRLSIDKKADDCTVGEISCR